LPHSPMRTSQSMEHCKYQSQRGFEFEVPVKSVSQR
jgi:hypothetical protein